MLKKISILADLFINALMWIFSHEQYQHSERFNGESFKLNDEKFYNMSPYTPDEDSITVETLRKKDE